MSIRTWVCGYSIAQYSRSALPQALAQEQHTHGTIYSPASVPLERLQAFRAFLIPQKDSAVFTARGNQAVVRKGGTHKVGARVLSKER